MSEERIIQTSRGSVSFSSTGEGPDLVLLHSLLSNRHAFDRVVPRLAEDFTVHLIDLPGFGRTELQPASMDAYGDLIGAMLAEGGFGPETALLGNGLGGFVALATAIRHGHTFGRLIIAGAGPGFPEDAKPAFAGMAANAGEHGMAGVVDVAVRRIFSEEYLAAHPEDLVDRREALLATDVTAFQRACEALKTLDYFEQVASITNPTLVVVGSDDQATPPALARQLVEAIPDSTYIELPGVAHGPQLQDPEGFLAVISPFLGVA